MPRVLFLLVLLVLTAAGVTLAQVDLPVETAIDTAELRVINAMLGVGPVDVYVNERLIGSGLAPQTATPYLALTPGRYIVAVYTAGADPLSVPIADTLLDLAAGYSKSAVIYQARFATPETDTTPGAQPPLAQSGAIFVLDDNRGPLELGKTRLTALHLNQGTPQRLSIAYPSRASLLHQISLEQVYGDIDIDAGVYPLTIIDADSQNLDRLGFIGEQVFQANVHYTLIIVPDMTPQIVANEPIILPLVARPRLFIISAPIQPLDGGIQLRIIHAAHSTAVVDVYVDGRRVAPRLNYSHYTEYLTLPAYSHLIELRRRDALPDSTPLATAQFRITDENRSQPHWSLLLLNAGDSDVAALPLTQAQEPVQVSLNPDEPATVFNTPGGPVTLVLVPDNIAQTARSTARVRVLHAIEGSLEITLYTPNLPVDPNLTPTPEVPGPTPTPHPPIRLIDPVIYGAEANENEVPAGRYAELDFIAGTSSELLTMTDQQFLPGMVYTFVLIGQPSGEPPVRALEIRDFGQGLPQQRLYLGIVSVISQPAIANVRRLPSNGASVMEQLANGSQVEVVGRNFDATWIKIRYRRPGSSVAQEGWIFAPLLNVTRLGDPINKLALPQTN